MQREDRKGGFRRFAVVVAVAAAGILVVGAHAASAQTIEICKSGTNGMTGRTFNYTVTPLGGSSFGAVAIGGRCTGPINYVGSSTVTVTELQSSPPTDVVRIDVRPSIRKQSENLAGRTVTVTAGASSANETLITFFNEPEGGNDGVLKICKLTQTPAFLGLSYTFTVTGVPGTVSATANDAFSDPATWSCTIAGTFQVGSNVTVDEQVPAGQEVQFIDTDPPNALLDFNLDTGTAVVTVGAGTTIVLFDNEPIPPSQTGFIEVCKNPPGFQDPAVTGNWVFTVTDAAGIQHVLNVLTNQCSGPIQVAAGIATVQETQRPGFQMTGVFTIPGSALLGSNVINGTATVNVPVSTLPAGEVQVNFINEAIRSQLKLCKALGSASGDLVGQPFDFRVTDVTDPGNPVGLGGRTIIAAATTQCVIFGDIPVGTTVQVEEVFGPDNPATPFDESGQFIDQTGPVTLVIGPGINTATITNTARGVIQVCKEPVRGLATQPNFQFRIDGGAIFTVRAGTCSPSRRVSVGNHTVTEIASANFEVTAITVNPPSRLVGAPDLANRTVTVSVPYGIFGETVVTFRNAIRTGSVKVCKRIPLTSADSLSPPTPGRTYNFIVNVQTAPGNPGVFTPFPLNVTLENGALEACSGFIGPFPVLQSDGTNTIIGVQEGPSGGGFVVDDILLSFTRGLCSGTAPAAGPYPGANCIPGGKNLATRNVNFFLAPGPQFATFLQHAT